MSAPLVLTLPEPPSVNAQATHRMQHHREKGAYQRLAWATAIQQALPSTTPPERVVITASFRLRNLRDEDNLKGSLKWLLDALKQRQQSEKWRRGIHLGKGYFVDDDPARLTIRHVDQVVDRADQGVTLTIEAQ